MFSSFGSKIVVFALTDLTKIGSLAKKVINYDESGQFILREYEREDVRIITVNFICVCEKGKTYWKRNSKIIEEIKIGADDLVGVEAIDTHKINEIGIDKFTKQLLEHVIGLFP